MCISLFLPKQQKNEETIQLTFSYSKSTIEALEKDVSLSHLFLVFLFYTLNKKISSSKLTIKIPGKRQWRRSGIVIVNSEHISHFFLVFYCYFEQVNVSWAVLNFKMISFNHVRVFKVWMRSGDLDNFVHRFR